MSRGRGGPPREHYPRHTPRDPQAQKDYLRPGPGSLHPRPGPQQQASYSAYYQGFVHPAAPAQPIPNYNNVAPKPAGHSSSQHPNYSPSPGLNSFQQQQIEFLRGQSAEAPHFGTGGRAAPVRPPSFIYHPQSGYSRYPNPSSSPRGRGGYNQEQGFGYPPSARAPRGSPGPRYQNLNQLQGQNHNQFSNRQWAGTLCESFQDLSISSDRPNRGGERFDRHSSSSSSTKYRFTKGDITLTPNIHDQVYRALAALRPNESIAAKLLARKLHVPKKIVNQALYSLERSQKASKQGLSPPEWSLYREPLRGEEDINSGVQSPLSHPGVGSEVPFEVKVELKTEPGESVSQAEEEDSDTESSSFNCSSSESSDSEEIHSPARGQRQDQRHPSTSSSPEPDLKNPLMAEQKERVLQYLLHSQDATALLIAKNLGLRSTKQVNPSLYALEKQGDIVKNGEVNPPTWELSTHRRERMERSLKAARSTPVEAAQIKVEDIKVEPGEADPEPLPPPEDWMMQQGESEAVRTFVCDHTLIISLTLRPTEALSVSLNAFMFFCNLEVNTFT